MPRRALAAACLAAALAAPADAGELEGRVELALPGVALSDVGPIVVYLEGGPPRAAAAAPPAEIRQQSARFSPPFLAVARGQAVEMPNEDDIYHNVFSFSAPNDFDLGLYPGGESRRVAFEHPGVVRTSARSTRLVGTLFVAPTPRCGGGRRRRFVTPAPPAGRFRLRTWAAKLLPSEQEVTPNRPSSVAVRLEATSRLINSLAERRHQRSSSALGIDGRTGSPEFETYPSAEEPALPRVSRPPPPRTSGARDPSRRSPQRAARPGARRCRG
jgi:plastocyanin